MIFFHMPPSKSIAIDFEKPTFLALVQARVFFTDFVFFLFIALVKVTGQGSLSVILLTIYFCEGPLKTVFAGYLEEANL